jgi:ATP-dependent RNA helicase DDX24/MAK5
MTIDKQGRVTPRGVEKEKRLNAKAKEKGEKRPESVSTVDQLCKTLKFRSKNPKVIDLTEEQRMPDTLNEYAVRCSRDEKDLYVYYYLS